MFRLAPPSSADHRYRYYIEGPAFPVSAFLTYQLGKDAPPLRSVLMIDRPSASELLLKVSESERAGLTALEEVIAVWERRGGGAITTQKSVVNRLHRGDISIPGSVIAVHRHGPVPVFLLNDSYTLPPQEGAQAARIGIYPGVTTSDTLLPKGVIDYIELLESFEIGLDLMFRRYLEDVAEFLFDIEHHSDLTNGLKNGKGAERVLAESIEAKIAAILHPKRDPDPDRFARIEAASDKLQRDYRDAISIARYARAFALQLIHQFYRCVGIAHDTNKYTTEFRHVASDRIRRVPKLNWHDDEQSDVVAIHLIRQAATRFNSGAPEAADQILTLTSTRNVPYWLIQFLQFAAFVSRSSQGHHEPNIARVFLSRHFDVPVAETLTRLATDYINQHHGNAAAVLSSERAAAGDELKPMLRTKIWHSDLVGVVLPLNTTTIAHDDYKGATWLAREVEHSFLLSKRLIAFVERGASLNRFANTLRELDEFLSPTARRTSDWSNRVADHFGGRVSVDFTLPDEVNLPAAVRAQIDQDIPEARQRRVLELVVGLLYQFDRLPRRQLLRITSLTMKAPETGRVLARRLYPKSDPDRAVKAFGRLRLHVKQRSIEIGGRRFSLIVQSRVKLSGRRGNHFLYRTGLPTILREMLPETTTDQRAELLKHVIKQVAT